MVYINLYGTGSIDPEIGLRIIYVATGVTVRSGEYA